MLNENYFRKEMNFTNLRYISKRKIEHASIGIIFVEKNSLNLVEIYDGVMTTKIS